MLRARHALVPRLVVACLVGLMLWLGAVPPAGARSGGSGGGFSRSSGSHSSGSSHSSSSRSSGSSYRSSGRGGGTVIVMSPAATAALMIGFVSVFIVIVVIASAKKRAQANAEKLSVGRVQLAFEAKPTKGLRSAIEAAVRDSDPSSGLGLWRLSQRVLDRVGASLDHVAYAGFLQEDRLTPFAGEGRFNALAAEARAFFDREVVRKDAGGLVETARNSDKANELTDEDGDFGIDEYFVVTLVMAAQAGPIGLPAALGGMVDVKAAVDAMTAVSSSRHVGFEVVWTPAAESDILGRDELLVAFPALAPL
ncbi:MAG: DUF1517 domain-containing protein [Myxococcota bacterium]